MTTRQPSSQRQISTRYKIIKNRVGVVTRKNIIITLTTPYSTKSNLYMGICHCHSTNSDGDASPIDVVTKFKAKGYDWISITDHLPNGLEGELITTNPEVEGILYIQGMEWGYYYNRKPGHHIVELLPRSASEIVENLTLKNENDPQSEIDDCVENGGICFLAHPHQPLREFTTSELENLTGYFAIGLLESKIQIALDAGHRINIMAEEDTHHYANEDAYGNYGVYVFANELSEDAIIEGLRTGNYFSSYGHVPSFRVVCENETITASCDNIGNFRFIGNGGNIKQVEYNVKSSIYTPNRLEKYVRVRFNRGSNIVYSNPIWID